FVLFDPGAYQMGSVQGDPQRDDDEHQHQVNILHRFWLKRTEVTQAEWLALMGTEPWQSGCPGGDCPVESVNWFEAAAWANALSNEEGLEPCYRLDECNRNMDCAVVEELGIGCEGYRLPTEAEWEYAARAGGGDRRYPWGDEAATCARAVMLGDGGNGCGADDPLPVCSRAEAPRGLCDMAGNVWEWAEDWYGPYGEAPNDGSARIETARYRVCRGGSWGSTAGDLRAASRLWNSPGVRYVNLGFRVARTSH
ncbi:MAG: formylglycine-generating enzyme family protein, partial [Flavobacteriaceae bacterium]|nr:formylglycine-generating enzyme family protein [Flavobacteriaceae bacterium]